MFKVRLITSFCLVSGFLSALFLLSNFHWAVLMLGITAIGAWEWGGLARLSPSERKAFTGIVAATGIFLLPNVCPEAWLSHIMLWAIFFATVFWLLLAPIWLIRHYHVKNKPLLLLIGALLLLSTWIALVRLHDFDPLILLSLMMVIWIADSFAYFFGRLFGRHKLAPKISPKKTWEGVAGAMLAASIYGYVLSVTLDITIWLVVGFLAITLLSIVGDLFESLLKRHAELKDSGNVLPGHGGVLDRIDGMISTLPLVTFYLYFPIYVISFYA